MLECLLIADDLTGACDAGVPFAVRGYRTLAAVGLDGIGGGAQVLALSTDSRGSNPAEFRSILDRTPRPDCRVLFKKIDSMLRGNAAQEIQAIVERFGCDAAVIAPSFPAMRRTVEAGFLRAADVAGFEPIDVRSHFRAGGMECCEHLRPPEIAAALRAGTRFLTADAAGDRDLDEIVAGALESQRRILWAGSAGLASALARALPPAGAPRRDRAAAPGIVLFCLGSDHPITLEQQRRLVVERRCALASAESAAALDGALPLVLRIPWGRVESARLCRLLSAVRASIGALIMSGGDTASLVCRAIGARAIELETEIAAGIPFGYLCGGAFDGVPVVTKSGAFGDPGALVQIHDFLTCLNS